MSVGLQPAAVDRRTVLRAVAAGVASTAVAGCSGSGGSGDATATETPAGTTDSSTPTDTPTPTHSPEPTTERRRVTRTEFEVCARSGGGERGATVTFDAGAVVVEGTILGRDACRTAALGSAAYDPGTDCLPVTVRTERGEDAGDVCAQVVTGIDYRARFTFAGGPTGQVIVTHDGHDGQWQVANERREG